MHVDQLIAAGHALDVREGDPQRDAIDGVVPAIVLEPHNADGVAAALAWTSDQGLSLVIEGGGTKRSWGSPPERVDVLLGMRKLNRILAHIQGDLTVTVEAGLSLGVLNDALRARGQQLPLDPPFPERATIGGVLATNDSGPLRHRFGAPRDLVIGIQLATTGGRLTKAGGQVVKNVAGYDLSKLVCGSFGTFAAIVSATFKLSPLPAASKTVVIDAEAAGNLTSAFEAIAASQLEPIACEYQVRRSPALGRYAGHNENCVLVAGSHSGGAQSAPATERSGAAGPRVAEEPGFGAEPRLDRVTRCLIRFAGTSAAVDAQADEAIRLAAAFDVSQTIVTGDDEARLWRAHSDAQGANAVARVSWLPAEARHVFALVEELGRSVDVDLVGRAGIGAGSIRLTGDTASLAAALNQLRRSTAVGNVVVIDAPLELKRTIDVWGPRRNPELLAALKRAFDPNGTLGGGRF